MKKVAVIGAGAWGTTLSVLLAEKGHAVTLWAYEKELVEQIKEFHENKFFLPGFQLPESIDCTNEIAQTNGAETFVFAVPTQFLRKTADRFRGTPSLEWNWDRRCRARTRHRKLRQSKNRPARRRLGKRWVAVQA